MAYSEEHIWQWLNDPDSFTKGQPPFFKVEFLKADGNETASFEEGVICAHSGPLMMFAGVLSSIEHNRYRDLQYYYGSYALSFRVIRPTRLQFWTKPLNDDETQVSLQVDSFTRNGFAGLWTGAQSMFWSFFPHIMSRGIKSL